MSSPLPPLNALRAFVAAARHSNFRLAAEELCVTPGAVSRQIKLLEERIGHTLFDRSQRQVRLTPVGARYFARVADLFERLATATDALAEEGGRRVLHLDCIPTFAMHWLLPRLPDFKARCPDLELSLFTAPDRIDQSRRFDCAIRRDPDHFAGLTPHPLMAERSAPVCSPRLLAEQSVGRRPFPAALADVPIIAIRARPDLWPRWCGANGMALDALGSRLEVDHTYFAIQAAKDGLGVALIPLLFIERSLAMGRLVVVPGCPPVVSGRYHLLESRQPDRTDAPEFLDWLRSQADQPALGASA
jgi:LysR family transcriptional regulator, glycine cleavage system transcriptional activator